MSNEDTAISDGACGVRCRTKTQRYLSRARNERARSAQRVRSRCHHCTNGSAGGLVCVGPPGPVRAPGPRPGHRVPPAPGPRSPCKAATRGRARGGSETSTSGRGTCTVTRGEAGSNSNVPAESGAGEATTAVGSSPELRPGQEHSHPDHDDETQEREVLPGGSGAVGATSFAGVTIVSGHWGDSLRWRGLLSARRIGQTSVGTTGTTVKRPPEPPCYTPSSPVFGPPPSSARCMRPAQSPNQR